MNKQESAFEKLLPADKMKLFQRLLAEKGINLPQVSTITASPKREQVPLSFAQQRLWFLEQLTPGTSVYTIPAAARLHGHLDIPVLERSFAEIIRRHEILRTNFVTVEGQPAQVILPPAPFTLPTEDLRALPDTQRETAMWQLVREFSHQTFDLAQGPLVSLRLLRLTADDAVLLLNMHHIIADEWSIKIFVRELALIYEAFANGQPSPLTDLSVQYADYTLWQRQWFQRPEFQEHLTYWKRHLTGAPDLLALPFDYPRPINQSTHGATYPFSLSADLSRALKDFCRCEEVTIFMTLLAALNVLLFRYGGQEDIVIGSPIANRTRAEMEELIGFFVNTLALRTNLAGQPTFIEVVRRVHEVTLNAYAHQDVPFEMVVEAVQPQRNLSHSPLFQVFLALESDSQPSLDFSGVQFTPLPLEKDTAKFGLLFSFRDSGDTFIGALEYSIDLFAFSTIERLIRHLKILLEGLLSHPQVPVTTLPLLAEDEREQLLSTWQTPPEALPQANVDLCLHQLFERQVQQTPNAVALITEAGDLTYTELNQRADTLARVLYERGVGPEVRVAVCLQRGSHLVVALLATLKAGGAYVPLDPAYPRERLAYLLQDAQAYLLLSDTASQPSLPTLEDSSRLILLDTFPWENHAVRGDAAMRTDADTRSRTGASSPTPTLSLEKAEAEANAPFPRVGTGLARVRANPPAPVLAGYGGQGLAQSLRDCVGVNGASSVLTAAGVHPDNLAYVIYTSGSTGQPKGVGITHRNSSAFLAWVRTQYQPSELAGVLALTSVCFDLSIFELFAPLCCGGTSIVLENVWQFLAQPSRWPVTLLNTVPSLMRQILEQRAVPTSVVTINLAGEPLSAALAQQVYEQTSIHKLYNCYGPTEDTTYSTWVLIPRGTETTVTIGQPLPGSQAYVLDDAMQPVPIGVVGELYLGGSGLARGYLNRPDLTADRFIPNPFAPDSFGHNSSVGTGHSPLTPTQSLEKAEANGPFPRVPIHAFVGVNGGSSVRNAGARLYRTGDLVRLRADKQLEYIGRRDHQIKLRGFRIELGEIEVTLDRHEAVQQSIVLARKDAQGEHTLIAYVVLKPAYHLASHELRQSCRKSLPEHLIPSAIILLDRFPLTPNGKIDRAQLPAPDAAPPDSSQPYIAPQTEAEQKIATIWQEVLHREKIGTQDNFFDLGGHSLLVIAVHNKLKEAFNKAIPLTALFQCPTIDSLAAYLCQEQPVETSFSTQSPALDLDAEVRLDPTIYVQEPLSKPIQPAHIFLTGATGFIGAFLLHDFLEQTSSTIHCLVRASTQQEGQARLQKHLQALLLWDEKYRSRIIAIPGNLAQPLLGLSPQHFTALAETIDVIYHSGAWVNFIYPYHLLKATNVLGTEEVLRLACHHKVKPVHYLSSTSVFDLDVYTEGEFITEERIPTYRPGLHGGYPQTKWVAEKLAMLGQARGLPIAIYRVGNAAGHSKTGACNTSDIVYKVLKSVIELGAAPTIDTTINLAPVDYVSQAIVHLSAQPHSPGKVFHIVNPLSTAWNDLLHWIETLGYPLRHVPFQQWSNELANSSKESSLGLLASLFSEKRESGTQATAQNRTAPLQPLQFACQNTAAGLAGTSITCPPMNAHLLGTSFSYLTL